MPRQRAPRVAARLDPRGEERAQRFLKAATEIFIEKGYSSARLIDIIGRAGGGSLSTLYQAFGDKEGLALAIMRQSIVAFGQSLQQLPESPLPPEQALPEAALRMLDEILSPERIVCHRIVVAEGLRFPMLRDWFFEHGVASAVALLTQYFRRESAAGRLVLLDNPSSTANRFYMTAFGDIILHSVCGRIAGEDAEHMRTEVSHAVDIFLRGILPRP